ncbi:MAG: 50S ribosomal protein L17 [Planctomycetes bacterium]|jgi:large subunit ribosomal protein L17|nr:50S ribosomal protein L17 [Phycisphaerae bacterium]NBB96091.1 50S ribosomal protein L17 [Planctomycetota bacterium]
MRHRKAGKSLSRSVSHRRALRRNMASSLIENGTIRTTEVKAKELRRFVEKLITIAKKGTLAARRRVIRELQDRAMAERDEDGQIVFDKHGLAALQEQTVVQKLFDDVAPRYADRDGGYTRIIRVADRRIGDAGKQVILMLVEEEGETGGDRRKPGRRRKKAERRYAMASAAKSSAATVPADASDAEDKSPAAAEETDDAAAEQVEGDETSE